jgi:hypothetical protein
LFTVLWTLDLTSCGLEALRAVCLESCGRDHVVMLASPALEHALATRTEEPIFFAFVRSSPSYLRAVLVIASYAQTEAVGSDKLLKYSRNEVCHVVTCTVF